MLNFIEPAPCHPLIDVLQAGWAAYCRRSSSRIRVEISETDKQLLAKLISQRAILCPNHADHDDPMVMFGLSAICKQHFAFLTAREIFKKYPSIAALWLQMLGCYSVVRAEADVESYRKSLSLLIKNEATLVIFPEGEISHQNMRLAALEDGPEHLALKAAMGMSSKNAPAPPVFLVPLGLFYRYEKSVTMLLEEALYRVEEKLKPIRTGCTCIPHRIEACYDRLLQNLLTPYDSDTGDTEDFESMKARLFSKTISRIAAAEKMTLANELPSLENIHKLRNRFNEKRFRTRTERLSTQDRSFYRSLKTITNLFAIDRHSFDHTLTQEEAAELISILEEELFRRRSIRAERVCYIGVAEPIDANEFKQQLQMDRLVGVAKIKTLLSDRLCHMIERLAEKHSSLAIFPICHHNQLNSSTTKSQPSH